MKTLIIIVIVFITSLGFSQNQHLINSVEIFGNWTAETEEMPKNYDGFNRELIVNGLSIGNVEYLNKDSADSQDSDYIVQIISTSILGQQDVTNMLITGNLMIDYIKIQSSEDSKTIIVNVYSTSGLIMMSIKNIASSNNVNLNDLNKGAYLLEIIRDGYSKIQNILIN